jgi:hypothetical protein
MSLQEGSPRDNDNLRILIEASKTAFFTDILMPKINMFIMMYDNMQQTENDPWRRYALTEVYKVLSEFKINLIGEIDFARKATGQ